jgi:hypothetical protein
MTPFGQNARALQARLNSGRIDPLTAALEGRRVFVDANDVVRMHWLDLEVGGYVRAQASTPQRPLREVLGASPGPQTDRLIQHITAYRVQRGIAPAGNAPFSHFFVEPLASLIDARARTVSLPAGRVVLNFTANYPDHPPSLFFGHDVFDRIVSGFVATLYLQLWQIA